MEKKQHKMSAPGRREHEVSCLESQIWAKDSRQGSEFKATEIAGICAGRNPWSSMYMSGKALHGSMAEGWTIHVQTTQGLSDTGYYGFEIEANVRKVEQFWR